MNDREWQELQDEDGGRLGDPRRCPIHGTVISSPDGMFDGLCGACETASDEDRVDMCDECATEFGTGSCDACQAARESEDEPVDDFDRSYGPQASFFRDKERE